MFIEKQEGMESCKENTTSVAERDVRRDCARLGKGCLIAMSSNTCMFRSDVHIPGGSHGVSGCPNGLDMVLSKRIMVEPNYTLILIRQS